MKISPVRDGQGYWVEAQGLIEFAEEVPVALERISDRLAEKLTRLQKEIAEIQLQRMAVEEELASRGGRIRPRRVVFPGADHWASPCSKCKTSQHNLNMRAVEVRFGETEIFCTACAAKHFPKLFG